MSICSNKVVQDRRSWMGSVGWRVYKGNLYASELLCKKKKSQKHAIFLSVKLAMITI